MLCLKSYWANRLTRPKKWLLKVLLPLFFQTGQAKVELLEATRPDSPIARFIDKRGEGIHHVAFEVADIRQEMERLREQGFQLLNEEPKRGADNKWVCFVHPRSANGVLVELCQTIPAQEEKDR